MSIDFNPHYVYIFPNASVITRRLGEIFGEKIAEVQGFVNSFTSMIAENFDVFPEGLANILIVCRGLSGAEIAPLINDRSLDILRAVAPNEKFARNTYRSFCSPM